MENNNNNKKASTECCPWFKLQQLTVEGLWSTKEKMFQELDTWNIVASPCSRRHLAQSQRQLRVFLIPLGTAQPP